MKTLVGMIIAVWSIIAFAATPQVKNVKAFQQYPWSGKIHISYEVVGDVSENAGTMWITAKDKVSGRTYGVVYKGSSLLSGNMVATTGFHKVIWDIAAQHIDINSSNVVFSVEYRDESYVVIDLSSGAKALEYPVTYINTLTGNGEISDECKTTKLVLRCIPPGRFKMHGEYDVTLTKPYYIGVFEVTQKQYELVMGDNPSCHKGDMRPVDNISYDIIRGAAKGSKWPSSYDVDEESFIGKLRMRTGLDIDLPTEAQWEYACRAGTTNDFNDGGIGRYNGNRDDARGGYSEHTTVGSYSPNAWGLYDMHGNISEWCIDFLAGWPLPEYCSDLFNGMIDPVGDTSGSLSKHAIRGGSWCDSSSKCTSSYRGCAYAADMNSTYEVQTGTDRWGPIYESVTDHKFGFRIALTLSK